MLLNRYQSVSILPFTLYFNLCAAFPHRNRSPRLISGRGVAPGLTLEALRQRVATTQQNSERYRNKNREGNAAKALQNMDGSDWRARGRDMSCESLMECQYKVSALA